MRKMAVELEIDYKTIRNAVKYDLNLTQGHQDIFYNSHKGKKSSKGEENYFMDQNIVIFAFPACTFPSTKNKAH